MPDFPEPVKDIIAKMLCVDVQHRITIKQIKQHPAFHLLLPDDYVYPTPLPPPTILDPINPSQVDPLIIQILHQIGFTDEELREDLTSSQGTKAKAFCFMLARRMSYDNLPWDDQRQEISYKLKPDEMITMADPFFMRQQTESSSSVNEELNHFPSSSFSIGFSTPCFVSQTIIGVSPRHEVIMTAIQKFLTESGFVWLYPNDQLILARRRSDGTDLMIEIVFIGNDSINIIVRLTSGDTLCFSTIVEAISRRVETI